MLRARIVVPAISLVCLMLMAGPSAGAARPIGSPRGRATTTATAYQIGTQHNGFQRDQLVPPLSQKWKIDLGGTVQYALIAGGRVYVTTISSAGEGLLSALDATTGTTLWGPTDIGSGSFGLAAATLDRGRVLTFNGTGTMEAYRAADGTRLWTVQITSQYVFTSPPTALNGIVYTGGAGSGGTVYALDERNGNQLWTGSVENGDDSSPAVTSTGVYVSYACNQSYDFDPVAGTQLWHYSGPCEGGGGATVAVQGNHVFTRDFEGNLILNATNGNLDGTYSTSFIPAFKGSVAFLGSGSTLSAETVSNGQVLWMYSGLGTLSTAPIVDGGYVYVGGGSTLAAVDATTGTEVWRTNVGATMGVGSYSSLAAGGNLVLVPASNFLVAYG